jgi:hypothetical protein
VRVSKIVKTDAWKIRFFEYRPEVAISQIWALLSNDRLDGAKGGLISKYETGFDCNLNNEDSPEEGIAFVGYYPSSAPEVKWQTMFHGCQEAEDLHHAFVSNPNFGVLYQPSHN